jgi:CheY-like chemotaxis protein
VDIEPYFAQPIHTFFNCLKRNCMKRILIVEDNPDMLKLLSLELDRMGFEAITARDGIECVERALSDKPDLVLLDILMPGMDGRETARALRSNPRTKDIPIIAATALSAQSDLNSCLKAGCNDCLVKPFTYKDLEEKLRALIREHGS